MKRKDKLEYLKIDDSIYLTRISESFKTRTIYKAADQSKIVSQIPGTILEIFVTAGQSVKKEDVLLILDAMKMQNRLKCPRDGKIKSVTVSKGERVPKGALLMELE